MNLYKILEEFPSNEDGGYSRNDVINVMKTSCKEILYLAADTVKVEYSYNFKGKARVRRSSIINLIDDLGGISLNGIISNFSSNEDGSYSRNVVIDIMKTSCIKMLYLVDDAAKVEYSYNHDRNNGKARVRRSSIINLIDNLN